MPLGPLGCGSLFNRCCENQAFVGGFHSALKAIKGAGAAVCAEAIQSSSGGREVRRREAEWPGLCEVQAARSGRREGKWDGTTDA